MFAGRDVDAESARLVACLGGLSGRVVLVANEVGLGIVPENPLARRFRDHAGRLNQDVAHAAQRVVFMAAGLPPSLQDPDRSAERRVGTECVSPWRFRGPPYPLK